MKKKGVLCPGNFVGEDECYSSTAIALNSC